MRDSSEGGEREEAGGRRVEVSPRYDRRFVLDAVFVGTAPRPHPSTSPAPLLRVLSARARPAWVWIYMAVN